MSNNINTNNVKNFFKYDCSRTHGCAWFIWDNEEEVHQPEKTGGWASIGGEPAFQFNRPSDLSNEVTWWTNLTKAEAWSLGNWRHIKHANFLGPNWFTLMSEWGTPQSLNEFKIACASWSEVFSRIGQCLEQWSSEMFNAKHDDLQSNKVPHPFWSWGDGELSDAIADKYQLRIKKNTLHPALEEGFCTIIDESVSTNELKGKRKLTLSLPRLKHAKTIFSHRFPKNDFKEVHISVIPSDSKKLWDWLSNETLPTLVRFDELIPLPEYVDKLNLWLGLRGKRFYGASMEPLWLTSEEAVFISQWTSSLPVAFLQSEGWQYADLPSFFPLDKEDVLYNNSIVSGLLSEALWRSFSTPSRTLQRRIKSGISPQMVWWRAIDRKICYEVAHIFYKYHFTILSYGEGAVTILFDNNTLFIDWVNAITESGVSIPKTIAKHIPSSLVFSNSSVDKWLKKKCSMDKWLLLDRLLWPWLGNEPKVLKEIMASALKDLGAISPPSLSDINNNGDEEYDENKSIKPHYISSGNENNISEKEWDKKWKENLLSHSRTALKTIIDFQKNNT